MKIEDPTIASTGSEEDDMATGEKLNIRVYESLESLSALRAEWESLLEAYPYSTTFSTWEWLVPWWRAFGGDDRLLVLAAFDGNCLAGLALLSVTTRKLLGMRIRVLRFWGDGTHDSDNLDFPVRPGYEGALAEAILAYMGEHGHEWDICELRTMPPQSLVGNRLLEQLKKRGWQAFVSSKAQSAVSLAATWEEYAKSLSAKERGKIGTRFRKLEKKYKLEIRKCSNEAELDEYLEAFADVHQRHWEQRGLPGTLRSPARRQFYRESGSLLMARHRLEFWVLKLNDKIVATQFGMRHGNTVFSLQEGFDPEYSSDSVGYVLRSQVLKTLIGEGVRTYDFLAGLDESKLRWGADVNHYRHIEFARPRTISNVYLSFIYLAADAKSWLRAHLPESIWQALKWGKLPEKRKAGKIDSARGNSFLGKTP